MLLRQYLHIYRVVCQIEADRKRNDRRDIKNISENNPHPHLLLESRPCESSCLFYLSFNSDFYVSKIMHL